MGADFKINEYGEIIRADDTARNKKPQKKNKIFLYFIILLVLVIMGFLLSNNLSSYMLSKNQNNYNCNPPASIQNGYEVYLNGIIGSSLTVKMYLKYEGNSIYSGWYYYLKNGANNKLTLHGTVVNDILRLDEYNASGEKTGTFEGVFDGSSYRGNLYVYHSNKNFNFTLYDL
ncbi:MAG: hypothetical protein J6R50_04825 [Alistipes sp.]|nr:hypothetical protein [Alistipes sp.]MBO7282692.1 hypothetical protein [Alistipes sp.]